MENLDSFSLATSCQQVRWVGGWVDVRVCVSPQSASCAVFNGNNSQVGVNEMKPNDGRFR
jgi:hypothetical protein